MAGFANLQEILDALGANEFFNIYFHKLSSGTSGGDWFTSTFRSGSSMPSPLAGGANPATTPGTAYDNTAAGGIVMPDTSPLRKYLVDMQFRTRNTSTNTSVHGIMLVDRLVGVSGLTMNSTGNKTVNSTTLPRYTSGDGVLCFLEVTTAGATTAPIVSMNSYTNQAGTGGRAGGTFTFPLVNHATQHLVGPLPLQAGDWGIRSVETINVATAGGGSGVVNLLLVKPILLFGSESGGELAGMLTDRYQAPVPHAHMPRIYDGATLEFFIWQNAATQRVLGNLTVALG